MPSFPSIRRLAQGAAVALLLASVAACALPWSAPWDPMPAAETASPTPIPTATPTPTPTPTPMSALDAFKAAVASGDFQAQGTVSGSVKVSLIFGSVSGPVTGTFKIKGGDSDVSITLKVLGTTTTYDNIVVGGTSYSRTNGGGWTGATASGKTLQGFVGSGIFLIDTGVEVKFGKELHHLTLANLSGVDPSAFGITGGSDAQNLAITSLSFWAEDDGTPAGLSLEASLDQKILGTKSHETATLEISIDTLSGVSITAPAN